MSQLFKYKKLFYFLRANKIAAIIKNAKVHAVAILKPNQTLK